MRLNLTTILLAGLAAGSLGAPALAQTALSDLAPVTSEMIANPDPGDWLAYGREAANYRYSPLDQITTDNVDTLQLAWARGLGAGGTQTAPLVYDGVMFVAEPNDVISAIDAVSGDLLWSYRRQLPDTSTLQGYGRNSRSIAIYDDKVYFSSWDNFIVALDMRTGQVAWETDRGDAQDISWGGGPIVANGVIVAGSSCENRPVGCYVTGHDAETGEELWRNTFIPRPGEEGDDTWGNDFESRWFTGVWGHVTYDPVLDLVFYGSSATGPASETQRGTPGGTLYGTNTRFAVQPRTGEIVWRHQVLPRDHWDQECTYEMMTADISVLPNAQMDGLQAIGNGGEQSGRVLFGAPCKTAVFWAFDAADGDFLYARDTAYQDIVASIDEAGEVTVNEDKILAEIGATVEHCPSFLGGRDWPPSSFNPETGIYYVVLSNACNASTPRDREAGPRNGYNLDQTYMLAPGATNMGRIDAIDVATGDTVWSYEQESTLYAPLITTAGGVIFVGGNDRNLKAIDSESGELIWSVRLPASVTGQPVTYEVDGRQYVAVTSGPSGAGQLLETGAGITTDTGAGTTVHVFALPQ